MPGTYYESIDFSGKAITVGSTYPNNLDVVDATVIHGTTDSNVVTFDANEDANSVLSGFTIENGYIGVICGSSCSPVISKCVIKDNTYQGIYTSTSASPTIVNNEIYDNGDDGIYCYKPSSAVIKNNLIYKNGDEGIYLGMPSAAATIRNNTIVSNTGRGIAKILGTAPTISNCIIWDNSDDLYSCSATYSCIEDGDAGTGNTSSDPNFVDPNNDDYHLNSDSPCVDAGDPNGDYSGERDIDRAYRVVGDDTNDIDMGADEDDCFPSDYSTYDDWVALGRPDCWCGTPYSDGYQCYGDADGKTQGQGQYRVFTDDLDLLAANWKKKIDDPDLDPCADIDHKAQGLAKYWVFTNDLDVLIANWEKKDADLDPNCPHSE